MRSRVFSAMLPAILAACAPSAPPASAPAASVPSTDDVPPVLALLDARERLALSSDQVVQLESIARDWEAANDALARRSSPMKALAPLRLSLGKQARPPRTAAQENNRRAAMAVERVLQPGQRQTLCTTQRLQRQAAHAVRAAKGLSSTATTPHGRSPGRAMQLGRKKAARDWPWCAPAANESRSAS